MSAGATPVQVGGVDRDGDGVLEGVDPDDGDPCVPDAAALADSDCDGDRLPAGVEQATGTDPSLPDTDGDGVPDGDEDPDGDQLSTFAEVTDSGYFDHITDPLRWDTDGDGLDDYSELGFFSDSPPSAYDPTVADGAADADWDRDGLTNADELYRYGTNPKRRDSDRDGLNDGAEVNDRSSDPLVWDTDGDGLSDGSEVNSFGTDPTSVDSDGDGIVDGAEDGDGDGLSDAVELFGPAVYPPHDDLGCRGPGSCVEVPCEADSYGGWCWTAVWVLSDPFNPDTDGDGLSDGREVHETGTDPSRSDTDGDGVIDSVQAGPYCEFAFVFVFPASYPPNNGCAQTGEPPTGEPPTTVPDLTVPDSTVPDSTVPDSTVPDVLSPEGGGPGGGGGTGATGSGPEAASETTGPQTTGPQTTVPQTTVPQTTVPQTTVPQTTVPQTTVSGGGAEANQSMSSTTTAVDRRARTGARLARTGTGTWWLTAFGGLLLAVGTSITFLRRRR